MTSPCCNAEIIEWRPSNRPSQWHVGVEQRCSQCLKPLPPSEMMNDEHLREKIRSILDEGNGMYGYERVDQLLALIHEERKGAVEEASRRVWHFIPANYDNRDMFIRDRVTEHIKERQEKVLAEMFPPLDEAA